MRRLSLRPICLSVSCFLLLVSPKRTDVERTTYLGREAYRLGDGRTEAVIVPSLGRVMRYGFVGGENVLWNAPADRKFAANEWRNVGGDKTWPAPQALWPAVVGRDWPPDFAWDRDPHQVEVLAGGRLRTTSQVSEAFGARIVREYSFDRNGDFVINQIIEKTEGKPVFLSIWSVTQIVPPAVIFVPLNPDSVYRQNFYWMVRPKAPVIAERRSTRMLSVVPTPKTSFKVAADSRVASLASLKDGIAFVQRASRPDGEYPDGAPGAGFPVEVWNNGDANAYYNELEILSPLRLMRAGSREQHAVRWSLERLPRHEWKRPEMIAEIEKLLWRDAGKGTLESPQLQLGDR